MKRIILFLAVPVLALLAVSCMSDPVATSFVPDRPTASYDQENMTRVSVTLIGSIKDNTDIVEYGFELAENNFNEGADTISFIQNPLRVLREFSYVAEIKPGRHYVFRSFFSNGREKMYSSPVSIETANTSKATIEKVVLEGGMLTARIKDNGGRVITDVGFVYSEESDIKIIKKEKKYAAQWDGGSDSFSLGIGSFPFAVGKTYYVIAYAEDAEDAIGYSNEVTPITFDENTPITIKDPYFAAYLVEHFDSNSDGWMSYKELAAITTIDVNTDNITSILEINLMPNLESLSCWGADVQSGLLEGLDISNNNKLSLLNCNNNRIDTLDLPNNPQLTSLSCAGNQLSRMDISSYRQISTLDCRNNPIDTVFLYANQKVDLQKPKEAVLIYRLDGFSLEADSISLQLGKNRALQAHINPDDAIDKTIIWQSSDSRIAEVSEDGEITGREMGTCSVIASCWGWADTCVVRIIPVPTDSIVLNPAQCQLPVNETITIEAEVFPEDATDKYITWSSSDESVATVTQDGVVSGVGEGSCNISAIVGGQSADCEVTVVIPVSEVTIDQKSKEVYIGENTPLKVTVIPENATNKRLVWTSSDSSVAEIDSTGLVMPVGTGTCLITATAESGETASFECIVVSEAPVFADEVFREYIYDNFDTNHDGFLSRTEALSITNINVCTDNIESVDEIRFFPNLRELHCYGTLTNTNTNTNNVVSHGKLKSLDVSGNPSLTYLECKFNQLTRLDVSKNTSLTLLYCSSNQLTSLDVTQNPSLTRLECYSNQLTRLDVLKNTSLSHLQCDSNQLTSLDVTQNPSLTYLSCGSNQLTNLDVTQNPSLTSLYCSFNQLTSLDVTQNPSLTSLYCYSNQLTSLDISNNTSLKELYCMNEGLRFVYVWNGFDTSVFNGYSIGDAVFYVENEDPTEIQIADANFRAYILGRFDGNGDGKLSQTEALLITSIIICTDNIESVDEIRFLSNLQELHCYGTYTAYISNGKLKSLDVSKNSSLTSLDCSGNQLVSLNVSGSPSLKDIRCAHNQLTSLDVTKNPSLTNLECGSNQLTRLDFSKNMSLTQLYCYSNQLTRLDVSKNPSLTNLSCFSNQLTRLDVSKNPSLTSLSCGSNQLTNLDVTQNPSLISLSCYSNQLTSLDVTQNPSLTYLSCGSNRLTSLDVSKNLSLTQLYCYSNQLASLDVSQNTSLTTLWCLSNKLLVLDVSNNLLLNDLRCGGNPYLSEIWLKTSQTISNFQYDTSVATIKYK